MRKYESKIPFLICTQDKDLRAREASDHPSWARCPDQLAHKDESELPNSFAFSNLTVTFIYFQILQKVNLFFFNFKFQNEPNILNFKSKNFANLQL